MGGSARDKVYGRRGGRWAEKDSDPRTVAEITAEHRAREAARLEAEAEEARRKADTPTLFGDDT